MVYACSVIGCLNSAVNQTDKRISYFPLPKEEEYCRKWVQLCPVINYESLDKVRVCSDHFDATFREWSMQQEMLGFTPEKLLINAVPNEKLPEPRELLKDEEVSISQWCNGNYINHNTVTENMVGYDPFSGVTNYTSPPPPQKINGTIDNGSIRVNDPRELVPPDQKPPEHNINKKKGRMTSKQIKILVEYMSNHVDFANNRVCGGAQGHKHKEKQWEHLARQLNDFGTIKSIDQWKKAWADLKRGARGRVENHKRLSNGVSSNGVSNGTVSEIDGIIVGIIGMEPVGTPTQQEHQSSNNNRTSMPAQINMRPSTSYGPELGGYAEVVGDEEHEVEDFVVHDDMKGMVSFDLDSNENTLTNNDQSAKQQPKPRPTLKRKSTCQLLLEYQKKQTKIMEEMLAIMKKNETTNERILTAVEIVANRFK